MSKTTARIILTASLIPGEPGTITSSEIRQRLAEEGFSVSERQIQRDLRSIHEALPEDLARQSGGSAKDRWYWYRNARVGNLTGRSLSEALALSTLAGKYRHLVPASILANLDAPIERARQFLASTPQPHVRHWPDKLVSIHGPVYRLPPETDPNVADTVTEAVYTERKLEVEYRAGSDDDAEDAHEEVDALGLLNRNNLTYLITDSTEPIPLHRIRSAKALTITVPRPVREPLQDSYWRPPLHTDVKRQLKLVLETDDELAKELQEQPLGTDQRVSDREDCSALVEVTARNDRSLIDWLLVNGRRCRVIEPLELSQSIRDHLREILDHQEQATRIAQAENRRREVREYSTDHFWITPYNKILPISRPHWSDVLRNPGHFELRESKAGCPLHELDRQALLDWAVDRYWIAIQRSGTQWQVRARNVDGQILGLVSGWAETMLELGHLTEQSVVSFGGRNEKKLTVADLLQSRPMT